MEVPYIADFGPYVLGAIAGIMVMIPGAIMGGRLMFYISKAKWGKKLGLYPFHITNLRELRQHFVDPSLAGSLLSLGGATMILDYGRDCADNSGGNLCELYGVVSLSNDYVGVSIPGIFQEMFAVVLITIGIFLCISLLEYKTRVFRKLRGGLPTVSRRQ